MNEQRGERIARFDEGLALRVLEQIPTPVMAVDRGLGLIFMNAAGCGKSWMVRLPAPCGMRFR